MIKVKFDRRKIRMSLEGWYFTFVLVFIGTAAILRRANLLLILAAMLTAPLLFNWRFVMASLRRLILRRRVPQVAIAGEVFRVGLTVENGSPMDSWHVQIDETIHPVESKKDMSVAVVFDRIPFNDRTTRNYECLIPHRGVYEFAPSTISTSYPLGLIRASAKIENAELLWVGPELGKISSNWAEWTQPDEVDEPRSVGQKGILDGMFYAIRDFRQGDSRRAIHWRSTAKLGKPAVKQFEKQSDRELNIVVDLFCGADASKQKDCEIALSFIATIISQACSMGRCQLNLLLAGKKPVFQHGAAGQLLLNEITKSLAAIEFRPEFELLPELDQFVSSHTLRGPLLIVSPGKPFERERPDPNIWRPLAHTQTHVNPFPSFQFHSRSGAEAICLWLDVCDEVFPNIFRPPRSLQPPSENDTSPVDETSKQPESKTSLSREGVV